MMQARWVQRNRAAVTSAILISGLLAAGCRADGREQSSGDVVIERVSDPLRVADIEIGRSVGPDNRIIEPSDEFRPNDTIYASVRMLGTADGATLTARWTEASGTRLDETVRTVSASGETIVEFHLVQPRGWAKGRYRVEILLDETPVGQEEFEVS